MTDALQLATQSAVEEKLPVCPCCELEVDGDVVSFLDHERTRCSRPGCVIKYGRRREAMIRAALKRNKRYAKFY